MENRKHPDFSEQKSTLGAIVTDLDGLSHCNYIKEKGLLEEHPALKNRYGI